jgi:hypothetical protein
LRLSRYVLEFEVRSWKLEGDVYLLDILCIKEILDLKNYWFGKKHSILRMK